MILVFSIFLGTNSENTNKAILLLFNATIHIKIHGILSWLGILCSAGGMYAIYLNKENNGAQHFKSSHGKAGLALLLSCLGLGLVGGIVLHPDFGIDKTNKNIRYVENHLADKRISEF
jgi:hypothetical protein